MKRYFNPDLKVLGIVVNQVDGRRLIMEREMEAALRARYGDLVFRQTIAKRIKIEESPAFNKPILQYNPKDPATKDFKILSRQILNRMKKMQSHPQKNGISNKK